MVDIVGKLQNESGTGKLMSLDNVVVMDTYLAVKSETSDKLAGKPKTAKIHKSQYKHIPKLTTKTPTWGEVGGLLAQLNADTVIPDNRARNLVEIGILKRMPLEQATLIKSIKLFGIHNLIPTRNVDAFRCMCVNGTFADVRVSLLKRDNGTESIRIYTNKGFIEIIKLK